MEGPFIIIDDFTIHPSSPGVIEDYEPPKNFPNCCPFHKSVFKQAKTYAKKFPNCCDEHRSFAQKPYFNIKLYQDLALHILYRLSFTEYHIAKQHDKENWYEDITDYIEYIILSFGTPPIGLHIYLNVLTYYIDLRKAEIGESKAQSLLDYVNSLRKPGRAAADDTDVNELYSIYKKWLDVFPFEVDPLNRLKEHLTGQLPIYSTVPVQNQYTKLFKGVFITKKELVVTLISKTKELLRVVNSVELVRKGYIKDTQAHTMTLINESHRIKQLFLFEQFSDKEALYVEIIEKWLLNEKEYFKEIRPLLSESSLKYNHSTINDDRKNIFNKMPLDQVEQWFMQLATNKSINGKPFLTTNEVVKFIDRAFVGKEDELKLTLNHGPKEKLISWKIFYQYYLRCISIDNGIERGTQCRDKYIKLLTENFTNFTFDEVKANFSKSNQVQKDWNLLM